MITDDKVPLSNRPLNFVLEVSVRIEKQSFYYFFDMELRFCALFAFDGSDSE